MKAKRFIFLLMVFASFWIINYSMDEFSSYAIERYLDKKITNVGGHEAERVKDFVKLASEIFPGNETLRYSMAVSETIKAIVEAMKWLFIVAFCALLSRKSGV